MSKGFSDFDVEFDVKKEDIDRLLKKYKKLKKYRSFANLCGNLQTLLTRR